MVSFSTNRFCRKPCILLFFSSNILYQGLYIFYSFDKSFKVWNNMLVFTSINMHFLFNYMISSYIGAILWGVLSVISEGETLIFAPIVMWTHCHGSVISLEDGWGSPTYVHSFSERVNEVFRLSLLTQILRIAHKCIEESSLHEITFPDGSLRSLLYLIPVHHTICYNKCRCCESLLPIYQHCCSSLLITLMFIW